METLFYVLKVGVIYTALFLIYFLLFRKNTNFQTNRTYLLLIIPLAFILPITNISAETSTQYQITLPVFELSQPISETVSFNWNNFIFFFYCTCSSIIFIKLLHNIIKTLQTISKIKNGVLAEIKPFSFFSFVYVSEKIEKEDRNAILLHERVHSEQLHSLDIIIYEISKVILWWNPFLWMGLNAVKSNHEFIADKLASEKANKYSSVLVAQLLGVNCSVLANNFKSNPLIKKRIIMMKIKKSNRLSVLKYALVIPIIGLTIMATTNKPVKTTLIETVVQQEKDKVYQKVDVMPQFKGGEKALFKYLADNVKYPKEDLFKNSKEKIINGEKVPMLDNEGLVLVNFTINKEGEIQDAKILKSVSEPLDNEAIRVIKAMPKWTPGEKDGKKVSVSFNVPIKFQLKK